MVEVIHQWPRLKYPEMAILKMVGVTAVLFLAGLLPWVDNYAHLFGFVFGFLLSYGLLPFVTFGGGGGAVGGGGSTASGDHFDRKELYMLGKNFNAAPRAGENWILNSLSRSDVTAKFSWRTAHVPAIFCRAI